MKAWAHKELNDKASVLRGKAAATNMMEALVQMVRGALLDALDSSQRCQSSRLQNELGGPQKWSITKNEAVLGRGKLELENLEMQIEVNSGPHNETITKAMMESIAPRNRQGRDKSLVSLALTACTLSREVWGRVPKH